MARPVVDPAVLNGSTLATTFAEAYRTLRANITFRAIDNDIRSIVVTSAGRQEGKTTTVINLGLVMAQAGRRTLLVDADFRRPTLHLLLPDLAARATARANFWDRGSMGRMPVGLSDLISESASLPEVVIASPSPDALSLLAAGTIPPNPSELAGSKRMLAVLEDLKQYADLILIDTPPCQLYADAFLLSQRTDAVLYVLRSTRQEWGTHRRLLKQFEQSRARVLGVVFNDVDVEQEGYDAYYSPGEEPKGH